MDREPYCCFIDQGTGESCSKDPKWEIWYEAPEGNTVSCDWHVMDLLTDAPVHTLHSLGEESARFTIVSCDVSMSTRAELERLVETSRRKAPAT